MTRAWLILQPSLGLTPEKVSSTLGACQQQQREENSDTNGNLRRCHLKNSYNHPVGKQRKKKRSWSPESSGDRVPCSHSSILYPTKECVSLAQPVSSKHTRIPKKRNLMVLRAPLVQRHLHFFLKVTVSMVTKQPGEGLPPGRASSLPPPQKQQREPSRTNRSDRFGGLVHPRVGLQTPARRNKGGCGHAAAAPLA